ncbi:hypothetical protein BGZ51_008971 [Haplosporangium sp. Z 767]|nr:hypothetical protein BGZ51_008971 [Haplosporangium sp. Z 767]
MEQPSLDESRRSSQSSLLASTHDHDLPSAPIPISSPSIKKSASQSNGRATKKRFDKSDIENILTWLENPLNFSSIYGNAGKINIEKSNKTAAQGYAALSEFLCKQSKGRWKMLGYRAMKERFNRHKSLYLKVKEMSKATGFGVTKEDRSNNIYTVARKLESMCTCYERMDALFGHRPNVDPLEAAKVCLDQDNETRQLIEAQTELEDEGGILEEGAEDDTSIIPNNNDEDDLDNVDSDNNDLENDFSVFDGDDISTLSLASPPIRNKRQLSDTESTRSVKRSRATDKHKRPPRLDTGFSPATLRNAFLSAFQESFGMSKAFDESATKKLMQERETELAKLELAKFERVQKIELAKFERIQKIEMAKFERVQKIELAKFERAQKIELIKLERVEKVEMAKFEWKKQKWREELAAKKDAQRVMLLQIGLEKGKTSEEMKAYLALLTP